MVFQVSRLVQATFIVGTLVYLLCYGFVLIAPELAWQMTGHMLHTDLSGLTWSTSIEGFFMGWVCVVGLTCLTTGSWAKTYNVLVGGTSPASIRPEVKS